MDVSFVSQTLIIPNISRGFVKSGGIFISLIKPQFEAGREKVGKKGVVRDKSVHEEVIVMVMNYAKTIGFKVLNLDFSPIKGPQGNIEYLIYIEKSEEAVSYLKNEPSEIVYASHKKLSGGEG